MTLKKAYVSLFNFLLERILVRKSFLELCIEGSQVMSWIQQHQLYQILFCRRRDNNCKGQPIKASIEWLCYEEERIFLSRFYARSRSSQRPDFYSKVFRRSVQELIGEFCLPIF